MVRLHPAWRSRFCTRARPAGSRPVGVVEPQHLVRRGSPPRWRGAPPARQHAVAASPGRPAMDVNSRASRRWRSREGITWRTVVRARRAASSMPAPGHGRRLQGNRQSDDLIVVEQQRRQLAARVEPVAAIRPHRRLNGVAHLAQPFDVATHRAIADLPGVRPARAPGQSLRVCSSDSRVSNREVVVALLAAVGRV